MTKVTAVQIKEWKRRGTPIKSMKEFGASAIQLKDAGFKNEEIIEANYTESELKAAKILDTDDGIHNAVKKSFIDGFVRVISSKIEQAITVLITAMVSAGLIALGMNPPAWAIVFGIAIMLIVTFVVVKGSVYLFNFLKDIYKHRKEVNRIDRNIEGEQASNLRTKIDLEPDKNPQNLLSYIFDHKKKLYYHVPLSLLNKLKLLPANVQVTLLNNIVMAERSTNNREDTTLHINFKKFVNDIIDTPSGLSDAKTIFKSFTKELKKDAFKKITQDKRNEIISRIVTKILKKDGWNLIDGGFKKEENQETKIIKLDKDGIKKLCESRDSTAANRGVKYPPHILKYIENAESDIQSFNHIFIQNKVTASNHLTPDELFATFIEADALVLDFKPHPISEEDYPYKKDKDPFEFDDTQADQFLSTDFALKLMAYYPDVSFDKIKSAMSEINDKFSEDADNNLDDYISILSLEIEQPETSAFRDVPEDLQYKLGSHDKKDLDGTLLHILLDTALSVHREQQEISSDITNLRPQYEKALSSDIIQFPYERLVKQRLNTEIIHNIDTETLRLKIENIDGSGALDSNTFGRILDELKNQQNLTLDSASNRIMEKYARTWHASEAGNEEKNKSWDFQVGRDTLKKTIMYHLCETITSQPEGHNEINGQALRKLTSELVKQNIIALNNELIFSATINKDSVKSRIINKRDNIINISNYDNCNSLIDKYKTSNTAAYGFEEKRIQKSKSRDRRKNMMHDISKNR